MRVKLDRWIRWFRNELPAPPANKGAKSGSRRARKSGKPLASRTGVHMGTVRQARRYARQDRRVFGPASAAARRSLASYLAAVREAGRQPKRRR